MKYYYMIKESDYALTKADKDFLLSISQEPKISHVIQSTNEKFLFSKRDIKDIKISGLQIIENPDINENIFIFSLLKPIEKQFPIPLIKKHIKKLNKEYDLINKQKTDIEKFNNVKDEIADVENRYKEKIATLFDEMMEEVKQLQLKNITSEFMEVKHFDPVSKMTYTFENFTKIYPSVQIFNKDLLWEFKSNNITVANLERILKHARPVFAEVFTLNNNMLFEYKLCKAAALDHTYGTKRLKLLVESFKDQKFRGHNYAYIPNKKYMDDKKFIDYISLVAGAGRSKIPFIIATSTRSRFLPSYTYFITEPENYTDLAKEASFIKLSLLSSDF